jgi:hypothetical protein
MAAMLVAPDLSSAALREDELRDCLQDFEGVVWKLPYQPRLDIYSCSTPKFNYVAGKSADGRRSLELIGKLALGPDLSLPPEEANVAIDTAVHTHFDTLFLRQGYRRVAVEYGNARRDSNLQYYLDRGIAHDGALPFVNLARYKRTVAGRVITVTYKKAMGNTWSIHMDVHLVGQEATAEAAK